MKKSEWKNRDRKPYVGICKVCNASQVNILNVKEKYYGTFEAFDYLHCLACGSLVIKDVPDDLSKYYSEKYYSFQNSPRKSSLKNWINNKYWQHLVSKSGWNWLGYAIGLFRQPSEANLYKIISNTNISPVSRILDVGCGGGELLKRFRQFGYTNVLGLDPNIDSDIPYEGTKLVARSTVEKYSIVSNVLYDLIMFNHSFEHMINPDEVLDSIKKMAHKNTYFLIRIPLSSSYAFQVYRENWVQLDAPRHIYLYSEKGIRLILEGHGFELLHTIYDSSEFQFWGSEQYIQDISLISGESIFTERELWKFKEKAKKLNKERKGDMAAFIFKVKHKKTDI